LVRIERSVRFRAPVREVFAYIADFRTLRAYNPSIREANLLTPEPPGPGSRFELRLALPVGSIRTVLIITEFERDALIATRLEAFVPAYERRMFRAEGQETLFNFTIEFSCGWPVLGSLADRLMSRFFAEPQADTEIRLLEQHFARNSSGGSSQELTRLPGPEFS